jgi:hypothetical protein
MANAIFYAMHVLAVGATAMKPYCEDAAKSRPHASISGFPSAAAEKYRWLDPNESCPRGFISEYDSAKAFLELSSNAARDTQGWQLVQDRPGKYGWIIDGWTGLKDRDTLRFDIQISTHGSISFGYMHTYENAGFVHLFLDQSAPTKSKACVGGRAPTFQPGVPIKVDAYEPDDHHSQINEIIMFPGDRYFSGAAVLRIELQSLSPSETVARGRNRFKVSGLKSC